MAQVPDKVLSWLYSVLQEYHDPQRTYADAARALSAFPTLSPRTEVYTAENGSTALLLTLSGTLPVAFRGTTYRFPVKLWVPRSYAGEPPIAFIVPFRDMIIRPGQHVGVDGRIYHPYLRDWNQYRERASIAELLAYLQQVFSKEPPVISKAQQQQYQQRPQHTPPRDVTSTGPLPPPRPGQTALSGTIPTNLQQPPPRPPKSGSSDVRFERTRDDVPSGPPLPPLPNEIARNQHPTHTQNSPRPFPSQNGFASSAGHLGPSAYGQSQHYTYGFSASPATSNGPPMSNRVHQESPVSPISPTHGYSELSVHGSTPRQTQLPYQPPGVVTSQGPPHGQASGWYNAPNSAAGGQHVPNTNTQSAPMNPPHRQIDPRHVSRTQKQPSRDLLSDPFDIAIAPMTHHHLGPAPPIPPNPEREHLLEALSSSLVQQAQYKVSQNLAAVSPLQAQQEALLNARVRLKDEMRQLEQISQTIESNERILHAAISDCDRMISSAKTKPQPSIDDILVAPTLVGQQLWTLTAEEAAIREAMYVLQKAVDQGRISGEVFVKQMRGLGREAFLKMALAKKCAQGMGLETQH